MPHAYQFDSTVCYKASQCTDVMDVRLAIANLEAYREDLKIRGYKVARRYYTRERSLYKRLAKLIALEETRKMASKKRLRL